MAFVGPTGSGKSSIIDALTFALYGSAARYDQRAVAPVINQMSAEARVRFDFELAGTAYTAVRVVRRTKSGGATTKEARLESQGEVLAGDERALSAKVVELLGLDFDKFNKTVVLPQGRFAEFLHDKPADRQELLRGLLGVGIYERAGKVARSRETAAANTADLLEQQLATAGDVSDERLAELGGRAAAIEALLQVVEALGAEIAQADDALRRTEQRIAVVGRRDELLATVVVPDGVDALHDELVAAEALSDAAATAHAVARERQRQAVEAVADGPSEVAMSMLVEAHDAVSRAAGAQRDAGERLQTATAQHGAALAAAASVQERRTVLVVAVESADRALDAALGQQRSAGSLEAAEQVIPLFGRRAEVAADVMALVAEEARARQSADAATAQHAAAIDAVALAERLAPAAVLVEHLVAGEPCPVCAQVVGILPPPHADAAGHVAAARALAADAAAAVAVAMEEWHRAQRALAGGEARLTEIEQRLEGQPERAAAELRVAELRALADTVDGAREAVEGARRALASFDTDPAVVGALDAAQRSAARLAAAEAVHEQAGAAAERAAAAVAGQLGRAEAAAALAEARRLAAVRLDADERERAAGEQSRRAAVALDEARRLEQHSRRAYDALRERVSPLASSDPVAPASGVAPLTLFDAAISTDSTVDELSLGALPVRTAALAHDWAALAGWAAAGRQRLAAAGADEQARRDSFVAERDALLAALDAALAGRVPATDRNGRLDVAAERSRLTDELIDARAAVSSLESERARVLAVQSDVAGWRERAAVARMLGLLLRTDAFERWLLEEALGDLVARANVRLHELTAGQYSLDSRRRGVPRGRPPQRRRGARRPLAVGRGDVPHLAVPGTGAGRRLRGFGRAGQRADRVDLPRRGLRHAGPGHARRRGRHDRGARLDREDGRDHHPHPRAGRPHAHQVRGHQGLALVGHRAGGRVTMRFAVESWAPEYGVSADEGNLELSGATVVVDVEVAAEAWAPIVPDPTGTLPERILFVDGVRRIDASVWYQDGAITRPGVCASVAAGSVLTDHRGARVHEVLVERGFFARIDGFPCLTDGKADAHVLCVRPALGTPTSRCAPTRW